MERPGPQFLSEKYKDLPGSPEVNSAVRKSISEGKTGPTSKEDRVFAYLDRLERLAIDPEKKQKRIMFQAESRPRALSLLREMVMRKYVRPHKEKMAQGAVPASGMGSALGGDTSGEFVGVTVFKQTNPFDIV